MTAATIADVHASLQALFDHGALGSLTDAQLLERFLDASTEEAEGAFTALVERHAEMVLCVCRATLGHRQDAEDAVQAVFLVLARRARSVRRSESAASWLHGVARRTALRARRDAARRARHERRRAETMARDHETTPTAETWEDLHREIDRLPDMYRAAIVLRHLEGLSHEECASRLGCPLRTFQSRLLRARDRLRDQLNRRGISLAVVLPDVPASRPAASELSAAWVEVTARSARAFAVGTGVAGASPTAVALARSVAGSMSWVGSIPMVGTIAAMACTVGLAAAWTRGGPPLALVQEVPRAEAEERLRAAEGQAARAIELRVVERAGGVPIQGADVILNVGTGANRAIQQSLVVAAHQTTDAEGRCRIEIPGAVPGVFRIDVRKPGYADRSYLKQIISADAALPSKHTIEMERGTSIGGIVKRRDGTPIAGARLVIQTRTPVRGQIGREDFTFINDTENAKVFTDAQGRWRFDGMPNEWGNLYLRFEHPDFVPPLLQAAAATSGEEDLRALKAVTILDEGLVLEGRVLDDNGKPISGASVRFGVGPLGNLSNPGEPSVTTDAEGRFRFGHVPAGRQLMGASAGGRPPWQLAVTVEPGMKPVELRLLPGRRLTGRVIDPGGKPIEGVAVGVINERGQTPFAWKGKTDTEGRFVWESAPAGRVSLFFRRDGYVMETLRDHGPEQSEIAITMRRPDHIRGKVVDARTGRPIPRFRIVAGDHYGTPGQQGDGLGTPTWSEDSFTRGFTDGTYEIEMARPQGLAVSLRIEAEGHLPASSAPIRKGAGEVTFDAKLEPAKDIEGVVLGRDGRPLPDADAVLIPGSEWFPQFNGAFQPGSCPPETTDSRGRFRFTPRAEPFRVLVSHADGYAIVSGVELGEGKPVTLTPWGRVEGVVKIGPRPAAGVAVMLSELSRPSIHPGEAIPITQDQGTITDRDGRYAFERVLPGNLMVARMFTPARPGSRTTKGAWRRIKVESGKTVHVDLGGKGRAVIGRFVVPAGVKPGAVFPYLGQSLQRVGAGIPYPPGLDEARREEWVRTWLETEEGRAYDDSQIAVDTNVRPDGSFRVDDVLPGRYRIRAVAHEPGKGGTEVGPLVAEADLQVIVSGASGGDQEQPLDLGAIEMKPFRPGP